MSLPPDPSPPRGPRGATGLSGIAAAAATLGAFAALATPALAASPPVPWTQDLEVSLTPQRLGVPTSTPVAALARSALRRSAGRLGLRGQGAGLRLVQDEAVPAGPGGGVAAHALRFQQTLGGHRVVWSQLDVVVSAGAVRSIHATVVRVGSGRPAGRASVSRTRAATLVHGLVAGRDAGATPRAVVYAGTPARGRSPRLAWVVETQPESGAQGNEPVGLCVVIDARTGKLLTTWPGSAARGESPTRPLATTRSATSHNERIILLRDARRPSGETPTIPIFEKGDPYASWAATTTGFVLANWGAESTKFGLAGPFVPGLEAAIHNTKKVLVHMCFTRSFCSNGETVRGDWHHTQMTGNSTISGVGRYVSAFDRVFLDPTGGYQDDLIAHELGHKIMIVRGGDTTTRTPQELEVNEGVADMFAYDYDREDAAFGEDGPAGKATAIPYRRWDVAANGEPLRMADYRCNADAHVNAVILGHAYFRLVRLLGPDVAGHLLYRVPAIVGAHGTYLGVANAFAYAASAEYFTRPSVVAAVGQAFFEEAGLAKAPPPCNPAAAQPPKPAAEPPPTPAPAPAPAPAPPPASTLVTVPDVRGGSVGAAGSSLAAVGLQLGAQRGVSDATCESIGVIVGQTPTAGTAVAPGSAVGVTVGQRPRTPCP